MVALTKLLAVPCARRCLLTRCAHIAGRYNGRLAHVELFCGIAHTMNCASVGRRLRAATALRHPNLVVVHSTHVQPVHTGTRSGQLGSANVAQAQPAVAHAWLVREFCLGGPLLPALVRVLQGCAVDAAARCDDSGSTRAVPPLLPLLAVFLDLARGLAAMHAAGLTLPSKLEDCAYMQVCLALCLHVWLVPCNALHPNGQAAAFERPCHVYASSLKCIIELRRWRVPYTAATCCTCVRDACNCI